MTDASVDAPATAFLDCFWSLASTDSAQRAFAAASLATHVSSPGGATHHAYAVKRLVRGLCSSRGGARQGFAAGLAAMLAVTQEDELPLAGVIDLLVRETAPTAGMRGAEERDLTLGRLFGLAAIARYANSPSENSSSTDAEAASKATSAAVAEEVEEHASSSRQTETARAAPTEAVAQRVLTLLLEVFNRRRWAREASVAAVRDLLQVSRPRDVARTLLPLVAAALESEESARSASKRHNHSSSSSSADAGAQVLGQLSPDHLALALCAEEALRSCARAADDDDDDDDDSDDDDEEEKDEEDDDEGEERAAAAGIPSHAQVATAAALFWPILRPPGFVRLSVGAADNGENMSDDDEDSDSSDDSDGDGEEKGEGEESIEKYSSGDFDSMPGGEEFAEFEAEVLAEGVPRVLRPGAAADALSTPLRLGSSSFPRLHLSWELVLDGLLVDQQLGSGGADGNADDENGQHREALTYPPQSMAAVKALWGGAAGTGLVGGTHQMKGTALALLPRVASRLPADHVGEVALTPSIVKLLLNSTAKEDNMLCGQARASLRELASSRPHDSAWRLACATALMVRDDQAASFNFDARTGTDTVGALLRGLDEPAVERYLSFLETSLYQGCPSGAGQALMAAGQSEAAAMTVAAQQQWAASALFSAATRTANTAAAATDAASAVPETGMKKKKTAAAADEEAEESGIAATAAPSAATAVALLPGDPVARKKRVLGVLLAAAFFDLPPAFFASSSANGNKTNGKGKAKTPARKGRSASVDLTTGTSAAAATEEELHPALLALRAAAAATTTSSSNGSKGSKNNGNDSNNALAIPAAVRSIAAARAFSLLADSASPTNQGKSSHSKSGSRAGVGGVPGEWLAEAMSAWAALEGAGATLSKTLGASAQSELALVRQLCAPSSAAQSAASGPPASSKKKGKASAKAPAAGAEATAAGLLESLVAEEGALGRLARAFLPLLRSAAILLLRPSAPPQDKDSIDADDAVDDEDDDEEDAAQSNAVHLLSTLRRCLASLIHRHGGARGEALAAVVEVPGETAEGGDEDEGEEEGISGREQEPLALLAAVLVALLDFASASGEASSAGSGGAGGSGPGASSSNTSGSQAVVRGLRDTVRRGWAQVLAACDGQEVSALVVDTLTATVCGDDPTSRGEDDEDSEEEDDEDENGDDFDDEEDEEEDDEKGEEDEEEEKSESKAGASSSKRVKTDKSNGNADDGENKDVLLEGTDALREVLLGQDESPEEQAAIAQALEKFLAARKEAKAARSGTGGFSRKERAQRARRGFQRRLRALDLLEALLRHHPTSPALLRAALPLSRCVTQLHAQGAAPDSNTALPAEARDLATRLGSFLKQKLFKGSQQPRSTDAAGASGAGKSGTSANEDEVKDDDDDDDSSPEAVAATADELGRCLVDDLSRRCPPGQLRRSQAELAIGGTALALRTLHALHVADDARASAGVALLPPLPSATVTSESATATQPAASGASQNGKKGKKRPAAAAEDEDNGDDGEDTNGSEEVATATDGRQSDSLAAALQAALGDYMCNKSASKSSALGTAAEGPSSNGNNSGGGSSSGGGRGLFDTALARHRPLALACLLPDLPRYAQGAACTPFLRGDAFRLLGACYRKPKSDATAAAASTEGGAGTAGLVSVASEVLAAAAAALEAVLADVQAGGDGGGGGGGGGGGDAPRWNSKAQKRVRPALDCACAVLSSGHYTLTTLDPAPPNGKSKAKTPAKEGRSASVDLTTSAAAASAAGARLALAAQRVRDVALAQAVQQGCGKVLSLLVGLGVTPPPPTETESAAAAAAAGGSDGKAPKEANETPKAKGEAQPAPKDTTKADKKRAAMAAAARAAVAGADAANAAAAAAAAAAATAAKAAVANPEASAVAQQEEVISEKAKTPSKRPKTPAKDKAALLEAAGDAAQSKTPKSAKKQRT